VIGAGGLGHNWHPGSRSALLRRKIVAIDRADKSLDLAKECGAHHVVKADATKSKPAGADRWARRRSRDRFRRRGRRDCKRHLDDGERRLLLHCRLVTAARSSVPTHRHESRRKKNHRRQSVGTYAELVELMGARGSAGASVNLHTKEYQTQPSQRCSARRHHGRIMGAPC